MKLFAIAAMTLAVMTACSSGGTSYALNSDGSSSGSVASSGGGAAGSSSGGASGSSGNGGSGGTPTADATGGGSSTAGASNSGGSGSTSTASSGGSGSGSGSGNNTAGAEMRTYRITAYGVTPEARLESLKTDGSVRAEKRAAIERVRVVDGSTGKTLSLPLIKDLPADSTAYADTFTVYKGVESKNPYTFVLVGEKTPSNEMPTTGTAHYLGTSYGVEKRADGSVVGGTGTTFLNVDFGKKTVTGKIHAADDWRPIDGPATTGFDVDATIRGTTFQSVTGAATQVDGQFYRSESNRENAAGTVMGVFSNQEKNISGAFSGSRMKQ
ncbi:transferrin-binding protein-like solute binding protein [Alysiella crassa]|uniref:Transferrin binding protein-like solute binding protein n=1 Tax=Alysiella crassa TaxID=153491 RepID=A0A376BUM1_9NEIS|nr:transferrin-binding protein-like solute binding protein [Alysiella crassa]UOP06070.1 transferrin-binding protein-like solute binding protein [Alysiella crassa]SSY80528.1 Transferrin binding protein-like solute binding protein [Alysiella crassa]